MGGIDARKWWRARSDYIAGHGSMAEVAERHGLGLSALKRRAASESWVQARAKMALDVTAKALDRAMETEIESVQSRHIRLCRIWDRLLSQLEKCVMEQEESGSPDRQGLRSLVSILRELQGLEIPSPAADVRVTIIDDIPADAVVAGAGKEPDAECVTGPEGRHGLDFAGRRDTLREAMADVFPD